MVRRSTRNGAIAGSIPAVGMILTFLQIFRFCSFYFYSLLCSTLIGFFFIKLCCRYIFRLIGYRDFGGGGGREASTAVLDPP